MEQALRDAQFAPDVQLRDLRSEFLHQEGKLRQDYLDRVAQITTACRSETADWAHSLDRH